MVEASADGWDLVLRGVHPDVVPRVIEYWGSVHPELGAQVAKQLNGG